MSKIQLYNDDCFNIFPTIADKSVDLICCDLPYGTTKNKWDSILPFDQLWEHYERIIKENGAIVLFGQDKFSAHLMLSNEKLHRYNLIWKKGNRVSGFLNAKKMPLRNHEDILVFYKKLPTYNPQMEFGEKSHSRGRTDKAITNNCYGAFHLTEDNLSNEKYPKSVLNFAKPHPPIHPTQKPVALLEYLIKTYTNEGDLVLDNCMGSGTCGVACKILNRQFIGIEKSKKYFDMAEKRINNTIVEYKLFDI